MKTWLGETEMEMEINDIVFDPLELLMALKAKLIQIVAVTVVAALIGWGISAHLLTPKYEASVNMIVNSKIEAAAEITNDDISSAKKLVDTYAVIIKSNIVLNNVIEMLGLDISYDALYSMVSVESINDTQVMKISVQNQDADLAQRIAKAISEVAPTVVVDAVEAGSCKVVSYVYVAGAPVYPNVFRNTCIAGVVGCVLCIAFITLRTIITDVVTDDIDVRRKLDIPVLGIIPDVEGR